MGTLEELLLESVTDRLRGEYPDAPEQTIEAAAQLLCTARATDEERHVLLLLDAARRATLPRQGRDKEEV